MSEVATSRNEIGRLLAQLSGMQYEDAMKLLSATPPQLPSLKLTELKGIAKHFRDQGFNIHLNTNKSEMKAALLGIISSLSVGEGPTISGSLQTRIINTSSSSGDSAPVVQNTIPTSTKIMPPRAQSQIAKPPIVPSQAPSAITSKIYPSNIENKLRELNSKKRRIFDEAEAIPGITPIEILDVLRFINTADCSVDAVVDKVVMKRSVRFRIFPNLIEY